MRSASTTGPPVTSAIAWASGLLVTPSGLDYDAMTPADIVEMDFGGSHRGTRRPTSEWRFHRDILAARPDVDAVLHSHAVHCTALAVHGMGIPAVHYMVAAAGGTTIRCASYRTPTTQALSDVALPALEDRRACLLQNHGVIVLGETPDACVNLLVEVEYLAELYCRTLAIGAATGKEPNVILSRKMAEVLEIMKTYGKQPDPGSSEG